MALSNERVKANLCKELKLALKNAALEIPLGDYISSEATLTLCNVIEAIFIHGLRDSFFVKGSRYAKYPEPNFWPFLLRNMHNSVKTQIESLSQIKTDIGRARAWIRIVLNENSMEHYLRLFARDPETFSHYYHKHSFLRDFENYHIMIGYLKGIANITIDAPVNSSFLNSWTPTPLILAGLVAGKPARLEQLSRYQRDGLSNENDAEEVGESALDIVELDTAEMPNMSKSSLKLFCGVDDDEVSSVYSHPSMIDGGVGADYSAVFYSSTPEKNDFLAATVLESRGYTKDAYQVNVKRRKHRLRYVSKSSSEEGNYPRSGSDSNLLAAVKDNSAQHRTITETASSSSKLLSMDLKTSSEALGNLKSNVTEAPENSHLQVKNDAVPEVVSESLDTCESGEACFCEDSCDSGVAEVSLSHIEGGRSDPTFIAGEIAENDSVCLTKDETFVNKEKSESSLSKSDERNRNDSILSLQDELILADGNSTLGNSLLGKGWSFCSPLPLQQEWEKASSPSSPLRTDSSQNFDSMMRDVVTEYGSSKNCFLSFKAEIFKLETSARCQSDSENFSETCADDETAGTVPEDEQATKLRAATDSFIVLTPQSEYNEEPLQLNKMPDASTDGNEKMKKSAECDSAQYLELFSFLCKVSNELGLSSQNFRCASCNKSIGPTFSSYRVCGFNGKYYCTNCCRKSDQSIIPSRLMHSWDIKPRYVSRTSMQFLRSIEDRPLFRLNEINPKIYDHSDVMKRIKTLRGKLALAAMYLLSCRQSVAEDLRLRLWPKEYLYSDIHLYSFSVHMDFQNAITGQLEGHLNSIIRYAVNHIFNCKLCAQKGFFCEICSSREVIYPFQVETTIRCTACYSVYHKRCYENNECRKCARREHYSERSSSLGDHLILE
uniref:RUN domain-containing protein n=1 Tax=Syphacia muris TaxID=451379 RepID=A0A158R4M8_9BILA